MDQTTTVVFFDDGVFQLISNLDTINVKDTKMKWSALATYGVEQVYVLQASLEERTIDLRHLPDWVKPIDKPDLKRMLHSAHFVISD